MGEALHRSPPEALRRRGIQRARDNVGADQAVQLPAGAVGDLFGAELRERLDAKRGHAPAPRPAPKPRNTRQRELPATEDDLLRAAYDYAGLEHRAGVSFEAAKETPALRRCLEIIAARATP